MFDIGGESGKSFGIGMGTVFGLFDKRVELSKEAIVAVGLVPDIGRRDLCNPHCCLVEVKERESTKFETG